MISSFDKTELDRRELLTGSASSNSAKLRLCILTPVHSSGGMGGAEYQIDCLLSALVASHRFDIDYVAAVASPDFHPDGYRLLQVGKGGGEPRFGLTMHAPRLLRLLGQIRPDVIYQRVGCGYTGLAAYYAQRHGARLVWHVAHDQDVTPEILDPGRNFVRGWMEKRSIAYAIRHARHIVTQTEQQARLLQQHYGRTPDAVIPNFHPDATEPIDKGGPISVLWVANFKRWKQPEAFVRLARSLADLRGVQFVMVGAPAAGAGDLGWGQDLMEQIRNTPNLVYLGQKRQDEVNALLARAHVLVNTSVHEGFPNTFIQAWMREAAVVSLQVNPDDVLGREGVGIHAGSETDLSAAVRRLAVDPLARARYAKRGRAYAQAHHSMRNAEALSRLIETGSVAPAIAPR